MAEAQSYSGGGAGASRRERAMQVVTHYVWWSAGWGFIPLPLVDVAAVTAVQLRMVSKLSDFYGVPFRRNRGKAIIGALTGGLVPTSLARGTLGGLFRAIPFVGQIVGFVTTPLFDGAATYAVGKVFVEQFESGGSFLDFDPEEWRGRYSSFYAEGRDLVSQGPGASPSSEPAAGSAVSASGAGQPKPAKA